MSAPATDNRYTGVAVGLHWLIAALIIGMLGVGKWMTGLELDDPLRFNLTQWHKSFGISVLLLSLFRLYWRATHKPPADKAVGPVWEKKAATTTHALFYVLLIAVPLTGWLLVSASSLNIPTLLFKTLPWPHIPMPGSAVYSEKLAGIFLSAHHFTTNALLVLVLLHVGAALRHQFWRKEAIFSRLSFFDASGKLAKGLLRLGLFVIVATTSVFAYNKLTVHVIPVAITPGEVRFTAVLMGSDLSGAFKDTQVKVQLDPIQAQNGMLNAIVETASFVTGDAQVDDTLIGKDWFDTDNYPQARFESSTVLQNADDLIEISGALTIKDRTHEIVFPVSIENISAEDSQETKVLSGEFSINRLDYNIGTVDQPDDSYVGLNILIEFSFELE